MKIKVFIKIMDVLEEFFIDPLKGFTDSLKNKQLSATYCMYYMDVYIYSRGNKCRIRLEEFSQKWKKEADTCQRIITKLEKSKVIAKSKESDPNEDNNYGYLYITPLFVKKITVFEFIKINDHMNSLKEESIKTIAGRLKRMANVADPVVLYGVFWDDLDTLLSLILDEEINE